MPKIATAPVRSEARDAMKAFNAHWPVGTAVRCQHVPDDFSTAFRTHTTTPAFIAADQAVVCVAGQNQHFPLSRCVPFRESLR